MTHATKLTVLRFFLVPVFAFFALSYGWAVREGRSDESLRWWAFTIFILATLTDGIDGWMARHFNQISPLGAFLDPIADKLLTLVAVFILTFFDWGVGGWSIPNWFAALVLLRDSVILLGIKIMWSAKRKVPIRPHWTGKVSTVSLWIFLGWVMLSVIPISPIYPCGVATIFLLLSMFKYIQQGIGIIRRGI